MSKQFSLLERPVLAWASIFTTNWIRFSISAQGSRGRRIIASDNPIYRHLLYGQGDPCLACEHQYRPECATRTGCPIAEAWEQLERDYAMEAEEDDNG